MCGLFGFLALKKDVRGECEKLLRRLACLSETRGKDASGLLVRTPSEIHVLKRPLRIKDLFATSACRDLLSRIGKSLNASEAVLCMGHTRMVTNGGSGIHQNNQPVIKDGVVCLHNGIIVNDRDLWAAHPEMRRDYEVDTEVFCALVRMNLAEGAPLSSSVARASSLLKGANNYIVLAHDSDDLVLATTNGSLFFVGTSEFACFASEKYILREALRDTPWESLRPRISQILPGQGSVLRIMNSRLLCSSFSLAGCIEIAEDTKERPLRTIHDDEPLERRMPVPEVMTTSYSDLERLCVVDSANIAALRRCSRCLLPESFPFISFNASGICNYCESYKPWESKGIEHLQEIAEKSKKKRGNGEPG